MSTKLFLSNQRLLVILHNIKWQYKILHIIIYIIQPNSITILLIKGMNLFNVLGKFYPKLVRLLEKMDITFLHQINNPISLLQQAINSKMKFCFMVNPLRNSILVRMNRMWMFEVINILPSSQHILTLKTNVTYTCSMTNIRLVIHYNTITPQRKSMIILSIIHKIVQKKLLVAITVTHCIHLLRNDIGSQICNITIHKINIIPTSTKNGIRILYYNGISTRITLNTNKFNYILRVPSS